MTALDIVQICADRGIAPGSTKGAAQHLRGVAAGLAGSGHRVTTYSLRSPDGPFPNDVQPLKALELLHRADTPSVDTVVYERYSLGHRGGLALARRLGVPFVLEINAPLVAEATRHRPDTLNPSDVDTEADLIGSADLVIAVSSELARWSDTMRSGPTIALSNGFEPAWFAEPATPAAPEHPLVFIGHPKPWHGADRLIDLLVALASIDRHPDLLVVGGGPGADALRWAARRAGVGTQLTITGSLPPADGSALLRHGGIGLAPYRRQDPFYFCPLKVIDYLAAGLPVIATDQGDIPGLVGDAGVVVDPDDDNQLVAAVAALLDDPTRRVAMGNEGRARAMTSMTWHHVAARTEAALHSVLLGTGVGA
ncbi:MAG: glycosyltransferase family 4 protein [Acidimicrobiia bacterium]|nr:glycosyltransferase family 4 protein [Acidimicrobiia bacterium]